MSKQEIRRIYRTALKEDFPQVLRLELGGKMFEYSKVHWTISGEDRGLRYGTNPHQKAALYKAKHSKGGIEVWTGSNGERTDHRRRISRMEVTGYESSDILASRPQR